MADYQGVFKRVEKKYRISRAQHAALLARLEGRLLPDQYGRHTICNIYFDTPDWRLIRASIDKPVYKEKLRLRSYGVPEGGSRVFVELKKKFKGVVYKRRVPMTLTEAEDFLYRDVPGVRDGQILREIGYFRKLWQPLLPRVYIAYDREAYYGAQDDALRVTFDENIRFRQNCLTLAAGAEGERVQPANEVLMEVKIPGAMPVWMSALFSELSIFPSSFSKYGTCYQEFIVPEMQWKGMKRSA